MLHVDVSKEYTDKERQHELRYISVGKSEEYS